MTRRMLATVLCCGLCLNAAPRTAAVAAADDAKASPGPAVAATSDPPRARVESGALRGSERDGMVVFNGVPYAAPPVGALRWQPPQPPPPWSGEREAVAPGATCMQRVDAEGRSRGDGPVSEDCLTLQIFAPKAAQRAPVMVWLHGGGNTDGSGSKAVYDGTAFARDGVVLVAVNYRLGPLGFFSHHALTQAAGAHQPLANYGLMDQLAALQWVARNIAAFGGDPRNVTVFGESAGGLDVLALLTAAPARGLFARAIAESPGGGDPLFTLGAAERHGAELAAKVGLPAAATLDQLRGVPADRLIAAMNEDDYGPVLDGRLLTQNLAPAFAHGDIAHVPLMLGSNSYEASALDGAYLKLDNVAPSVLAAYGGMPPGDNQQLAAEIFGDREFAAPLRQLARQASRRAAVWLYRFSYVRVSQRQKVAGAPHASELVYVFDSWDKVSSRSFMLPAEDRAMTALVHSCWITFASRGEPSCQGAPAWPRYTAQGDEMLDLGQVVTVRQHFHQKQLDAQERAAAAGQ